MQASGTSERDFAALLEARADAGLSVVLGLDPVYERIPLCVPGRFNYGDVEPEEEALAYYNFCTQIVDATHSVVVGFKPNTAFFEAAGAPGYAMLRLLIRHIHRVAPRVVVIVDAKRTDIGKSNHGTVRFVFDILGADAVTVNPYFGEDALRPFLDRPGKGVIVLCRTSNPGAAEFQSLEVTIEGVPLYQQVARRVGAWETKGSTCVVVGATAPEEMREVRGILPEMWFLAPGVGAQGGSLEEALRSGSTAAGRGILINSGSADLYASDGPDFAEATRARIMKIS